MMNETGSIRIVRVDAVAEHTLRIHWGNGANYAVDLAEPVFRLKGLRPLRRPDVFAGARVGEGGHSVAWAGEMDMGADRLWEMSLQQNGHADAAEFLRWRWRNGLSLTASAEALGLWRRMVADYASGERAVPRTVLLACKGWELEHQQAA